MELAAAVEEADSGSPAVAGTAADGVVVVGQEGCAVAAERGTAGVAVVAEAGTPAVVVDTGPAGRAGWPNPG